MTDAADQREGKVIHHLARELYLSFCQHKGWTPNRWPYVDEGSLRAAEVAVNILGYDDAWAEQLP